VLSSAGNKLPMARRSPIGSNMPATLRENVNIRRICDHDAPFHGTLVAKTWYCFALCGTKLLLADHDVMTWWTEPLQRYKPGSVHGIYDFRSSMLFCMLGQRPEHDNRIRPGTDLV
jgi:hypothetical protein